MGDIAQVSASRNIVFHTGEWSLRTTIFGLNSSIWFEISVNTAVFLMLRRWKHLDTNLYGAAVRKYVRDFGLLSYPISLFALSWDKKWTETKNEKKDKRNLEEKRFGKSQKCLLSSSQSPSPFPLYLNSFLTPSIHFLYIVFSVMCFVFCTWRIEWHNATLFFYLPHNFLLRTCVEIISTTSQ